MGIGIPLPVLDSSDHIARGGASTLEADLSKVVRGQVRFGRHDRLLYSTDASPYQVEPLGVVVPIDADDVAAVMTLCAQRRIPVLPRGGGTSLAGQCTNRAVVIDLSALCRRVISVDPQEPHLRSGSGNWFGRAESPSGHFGSRAILRAGSCHRGPGHHRRVCWEQRRRSAIDQIRTYKRERCRC